MDKDGTVYQKLKLECESQASHKSRVSRKVSSPKRLKHPLPTPKKAPTNVPSDDSFYREFFSRKPDLLVFRFSSRILRVLRDTYEIDNNKSYKKWAIKNHPDKGGDSDTFAKVSKYIRTLRELRDKGDKYAESFFASI